MVWLTVTVVCTPWECETTYYIDDYWCFQTPTNHTQPPENNPADNVDVDLVIDDFRDVLDTTDPCAWEFEENDRLGTEHGGPNTERPNHRGVDIQANAGDEVGVVAHGTIATIGWQDETNHAAGCGYRIIVHHLNGDDSVYCHLIENSERFRVGDAVRSGAVIGEADSTGNSTGHHLHLIYWLGGWQAGNAEEYWTVTGTAPNQDQLDGDC